MIQINGKDIKFTTLLAPIDVTGQRMAAAMNLMAFVENDTPGTAPVGYHITVADDAAAILNSIETTESDSFDKGIVISEINCGNIRSSVSYCPATGHIIFSAVAYEENTILPEARGLSMNVIGTYKAEEGHDQFEALATMLFLNAVKEGYIPSLTSSVINYEHIIHGRVSSLVNNAIALGSSAQSTF